MSSARATKGFTIVELLIVVAIIAVLAGLLLVGVAMLKEQSRRVACGNNLRSWGLAAIAASTDNQGALYGSFYEGQTSSVQPQIMAVNDSFYMRAMVMYYSEWGWTWAYGATHPIVRNKDFNIVRMAQYMDGGEQVIEEVAKALDTTASDLVSFSEKSRFVPSTKKHADLSVASFSAWRCPSQRAGLWVIPADGERAVSYVQGIGYSYFARSDLWKSGYGGGMPAAKMITIHAGAEPTIVDAWVADGATSAGVAANVNVNGIDAVCGRQANGDRILMTETMFYDGTAPTQTERLNGPNHVKTFGVKDVRGDVKAMTGMNVLLGDGRVAWRSASVMNTNEIAARMSDGRQRHFVGPLE